MFHQFKTRCPVFENVILTFFVDVEHNLRAHKKHLDVNTPIIKVRFDCDHEIETKDKLKKHYCYSDEIINKITQSEEYFEFEKEILDSMGYQTLPKFRKRHIRNLPRRILKEENCYCNLQDLSNWK